MVFSTAVYPKLMFYIPSRPEPFYFDHGLFNTDDIEEPRERKEAEQVLFKLSNNPGMTGVQLHADTRNPFVCDVCGKAFDAQIAMQGHMGGAHKTAQMLDDEARREGSTVPGNVSN